MTIKKIPEAPGIWAEIATKLDKTNNLYERKQRLYKGADIFLKVSLSITALGCSAFLVTLIRAYWVCGF